MTTKLPFRFFLVAALLAVFLSGGAQNYSEYDFSSGGLYFIINSDGLSVTVTRDGSSSRPENNYDNLSGTVNIPATVTNGGTTYTVTAIGANAFAQNFEAPNRRLTGVVVPNTVTSIGSGAFNNCAGLGYASLGESVTTIGSAAFAYCQLNEIIIPDACTFIGSRAFDECNPLSNITIGRNVQTIGASAFNQCYYLRQITCRATTPPAFGGNPKFTFTFWDISQCKLIVPLGCSSAYASAMYWNWFTNVSEVDFGYTPILVTSVTLNQASAMLNPGNTLQLTAAVTPANASNQTLAWSSSNTSIATVDRNGLVTAKAVGNCTITVTSTDGSGKSAQCIVTVKEVSIEETVKACQSTLTFDMSSIEYLGVGESTELLPVTLNRIDDAENFIGINFTIQLPNGLKASACLSSDDTKAGGSQCLSWTAEWDETKNEYHCLASNATNTPITLNQAVICRIRLTKTAELSDGAEIRIKDLYYTDSEGLSHVFTPAGGYPVNDNNIAAGYFFFVRNPNGTTIIPGYGNVFKYGNLWYLKNADNGTASVISNIYAGRIDIPEKAVHKGVNYDVNSIVDNAFYNSTGLTAVTFPSSLQSIGEQAFMFCQDLTGIEIPASVATIGQLAFHECSSIRSITVDPDNPVYDSRNSCNAIIKTSSNSLVKGCPATTIPNTVRHIFNYAFQSSRGMTDVYIPNSVQTVGWASFRYCDELKNITLGKSLNQIYNFAFSGISNLATITCKAPAPPKAGVNSFQNVPVETCTLIVPRGSANLYRAADFWKEFANIIEIDEGDMNFDHTVDIADVNILINILLGNDETANYNGRAFITDDTQVDIADVNALINILIGNISSR